jgi:hypothetical protein
MGASVTRDTVRIVYNTSTVMFCADIGLCVFITAIATIVLPNARCVAGEAGRIMVLIVLDSLVYSNSFHSYDVLEVSEFQHFRIINSEKLFDHLNHINEIENSWNQARRHRRKYYETTF